MSSNRLKFLEETAELIRQESLETSFYEKRKFVMSFLNRPPTTIRSFEQLNELDLAETLGRYYRRVESIGSLLGVLFVAGGWQTYLGRMYPISKVMVGALLYHYGGEASTYMHIDEFYLPLKRLQAEKNVPAHPLLRSP
jgi:hypothetical protein